MPSSTLFAHLAQRFAAHPENLATEALHYVLSRSETARSEFLGVIAESGHTIEGPLHLATQVTNEQDGAIPDLVGTDRDGRPLLIVEAKFWAGLTRAQPVTYLERLPEGGGVLLFLAPAARFATLWSELRNRCERDEKGGWLAGPQRQVDAEYLAQPLRGGSTLALLSWRRILGTLARALEVERSGDLAADVRQLQGLCARMDDEAFLPFTSEELTGALGRCIRQLCDVVDAVAVELKARGICSLDGLRAGGARGAYSRYMWTGNALCELKFSPSAWCDLRATPLF